MTTGKEAFESACQIGVAKSYNYRQLSQVFYGIDQAIQEIASSGGGNIVISGSQPDGEEEGQIAFFQGVDGNYYEYIWVGGSWVNVKTQNDDVTVAGSAPFITISGTEIETQRDINHYLNEKIESLILDPSGEPIDLEPFATIEYSDAEDAKLQAQIDAIDLTPLATIEYSDTEDAKLQAQIDALTPEPDLGPPTTVTRLYRFSRTTLNNGEMFGSSEDAELLGTLAFADKDAANQDTPVFSEGDEVSFGGWTYKFLNSAGKVEYVSGPGGNISVGTRYTVTFTIYPTGLANRVAAGEQTQAEIQQTIVTALDTQSSLQRQIIELEEELEALMPSVDRGEWDFSIDVDPGSNGENQGLYTMLRVFTQADREAAQDACTVTYAECMQSNQGDPVAQGQCNTDYTLCSNAVPEANSTNPTPDFSQCEVLRFATYDANNESHNWILDVQPGTYINVFNADNDDYALYQVTAVQGMWYEGRSDITVNVISAKGTATGRGRFKVFTLDEDSGVDLTNYLQKSGGTMTGSLILDAPKDKTLLRMSKNGTTEIEFVNHEEGLWIHADTAFKIVGYRNGALSQMLKVYKDDIDNDDPADDKPGGIRISNMRDPASALDGVNLSYMEDYVSSYYSGFTGEYLRLDGGVLTGNLVLDTGSGLYSKEIIKSTRNTGYAFQVRPDDGDATASIHTNGNSVFKHIDNKGHINTEEGGWVGGNWGFYNPTKGIRFYNDDKSTHFADITRQGIVLENKMYADNLWTLKVQDANDSNSKTLIYGDYSSGLILNEVGELNTNGNVSIGGNLSFPNGGQINVSSGGTVLTGRASLDIKTAADYPVVFSSGSSYKKLVAFYGYDGDADDNRSEVASINANGNAYFNDVFSNGEQLATVGNGMRWKHATHEVAADLVEGEFFVASSNGNIYLHPTSYDGIDLGVGSTATSVTDIKQLGTIHRANGDSAYHITWNQITYNNGSNKYIRISKNATHLGDSTTQGEIYRLNIPGFTF